MREPYSVQRLNGRYVLRVRSETGKLDGQRRVLDAADRQGAEAEARALWNGSQRRHWTVGSLVPAYITTRRAAGITDPVRLDNAWKAMRPFWERILPGSIDEPMCRAYAKQRKAAPATIRKEAMLLSAALRWGAEKGHIPRAPKIWRPAPPERVGDKHLSRAAFAKWFDAVRAPHARLYVEIAMATCARPGAILDLTWDRVNLDAGIANLSPVGRIGTKKRRPVVPLSDRALAAMREAYAARQSAWVIERGGERISNIKKAFEAASQRSTVHCTPYTLRHTGAVWKAEDGISMDELAQLMGHDSAGTTAKHYARYTPGYLRAAANAGAW